MPRARPDATPGAGRPVKGSVDVRPFKNGADASFWLRIMIDGRRVSRRLGLASEGWTPVLAEAERRRVVAEIQAGIYREPTEELPARGARPDLPRLGKPLARHAHGRDRAQDVRALRVPASLPSAAGVARVPPDGSHLPRGRRVQEAQDRRDAPHPGRDPGRRHAAPRERPADEAVAEDNQPRDRPALGHPRRGRPRRRTRHQDQSSRRPPLAREDPQALGARLP